MRLVVDTSLLVGELLRAAGRVRMADERLELFIPEQMREELAVELPRRVSAFARRRALSVGAARELIAAAAEAAETNVGAVESAVYRAAEDEATWRCVQDPADWPLVACAIALDAGVWTNDTDLFGSGVPTWVAATVQGWLDHQPGAA